MPEDIPIKKAKPDQFIKRRDMIARKQIWPIATPSGRPLAQPERRSDMFMNENPKRRYNQAHDRRGSLPNYSLVYK